MNMYIEFIKCLKSNETFRMCQNMYLFIFYKKAANDICILYYIKLVLNILKLGNVLNWDIKIRGTIRVETFQNL